MIGAVRGPRPRYYGWTIIWTLAVTETVSWGILFYAFSVFLQPMEEDLGWSRAQLSGAFTLALLVSGLAAPFAGRWIDRRGARALMTFGSCLGASLLLVDTGTPRALPAELTVEREERVLTALGEADCWVVLLRAGAMEERLWVEKSRRAVVRTEQATAVGKVVADLL